MQCAICSHTIDIGREPFAATTTGEYVHVSCADQQARTTHLVRTILAVSSAGLIATLIKLLLSIDSEANLLLLTSVTLIALHIFVYRLWWRLSLRSIYLW